MDNNELEEATRRALLGYIKLLQTSISLAGPRVQALVELEQENTKLRDTIDQQNKTISELSAAVLALKKKLQ